MVGGGCLTDEEEDEEEDGVKYDLMLSGGLAFRPAEDGVSDCLLRGLTAPGLPRVDSPPVESL